MSFRSIFESNVKLLDEKDGLAYPRPTSLKFLKNAVLFNENGVIEESLDVFADNAKYLEINTDNDTYGLITCEKLPAVFSKTELLSYIHSICYMLENHEVSTVDEALKVFDKFIEFDGDPLAYIDRCKSMPEYAWFDEDPTSVHMLMLVVVHRRNPKILEATAAKYFSLKHKEKA